MSYILNWRAMVIHLTVGLMKKTLYKNESILWSTIKPFGWYINIKVDVSN